MASPLTAEEMRALGVYFSQQKAKGSAAKDHEVVLAGQKVYRGGNAASGLPPCAACHTPTGVGIPARYPRLSGQCSDYTYAQLKAFKAGERGSDKEGKDIKVEEPPEETFSTAARSLREAVDVPQYREGLNLVNASFKQQQDNPGVTEIEKIPGHGHALIIDSGWRDVADKALAFVKRFT